MVRKPALELLHYLKNTNFAHPAIRYVLCILSCLRGLLSQCFPPSNVRKEEMQVYSLLAEVFLLVMFSLTPSVLDGEKGTGKTLSLCHIIHFCAKQDWLILHIPDGKNFSLHCAGVCLPGPEIACGFSGLCSRHSHLNSFIIYSYYQQGSCKVK